MGWRPLIMRRRGVVRVRVRIRGTLVSRAARGHRSQVGRVRILVRSTVPRKPLPCQSNS